MNAETDSFHPAVNDAAQDFRADRASSAAAPGGDASATFLAQCDSVRRAAPAVDCGEAGHAEGRCGNLHCLPTRIAPRPLPEAHKLPEPPHIPISNFVYVFGLNKSRYIDPGTGKEYRAVSIADCLRYAHKLLVERDAQWAEVTRP